MDPAARGEPTSTCQGPARIEDLVDLTALGLDGEELRCIRGDRTRPAGRKEHDSSTTGTPLGLGADSAIRDEMRQHAARAVNDVEVLRKGVQKAEPIRTEDGRRDPMRPFDVEVLL